MFDRTNPTQEHLGGRLIMQKLRSAMEELGFCETDPVTKYVNSNRFILSKSYTSVGSWLNGFLFVGKGHSCSILPVSTSRTFSSSRVQIQRSSKQVSPRIRRSFVFLEQSAHLTSSTLSLCALMVQVIRFTNFWVLHRCRLSGNAPSHSLPLCTKLITSVSASQWMEVCQSQLGVRNAGTIVRAHISQCISNHYWHFSSWQ